MKKPNIKNLLTASIAALALSCATTPGMQEFPATASAKDEVSKFQTDMDQASGDQVDVLSPAYYEEARESLEYAKRSLDKQADAKDTLYYVAEGKANLTQAKSFAKLSRANIEDVVIARKAAIDAGAATLKTVDFKKADEALTDVTADIEKNELASARKNRSALQLMYLNVELEAIKQTRIGSARDTIKQAQKEGAKEFAPRSLAAAEKSVKDTDAYITANRHNDEEVETRSKETVKAAEHLLKITRDSKGGQKTSSEDTALQIENEQNKTAAVENKLGTSVEAKKELEAKNANLESNQSFNERFEAARKEFSPAEAEVYKQGDQLVIRLRGLDFPTAKAELRGASFALLGKVQKVINDFGKGSVIVEGHTDSRGGKVLNEKLSVERAEAVKAYLLSINGKQPMDVEAVGYGFQKPLASNKTPTGRSQNRRVDVLIRAARM